MAQGRFYQPSMAPNTQTARAEYLDHISQELLVSAPAISAHLQLTRHALAESTHISSDDRGRVCKACGSTLILSWSCKRVGENRGKERRLRRRIQALKEGSANGIKVCCDRCDSVTTMNKTKADQKVIQQIQKMPPQPRPVSQQPIVQANPIAQLKPAESAKTNSRKRSQKRSSTLQSMLKQSQKAMKSIRSGGFGLDLQDLMAT